ncbi:fibrillin-2-like isoform X1 [Mya arenaria]|uniref:fibrillin-2-like isoform X1 n=1 Tax=Mya arenaria TaxID=6604 RepID=UPI0022DF77CA|nr:fibrillin-2-like isoform X1 [Mya arenaria]
MLEGVSTCLECEDSYWGHECNNTCDCNDRGTVECSPVRGCVCEPGWSGSACDDDVNECEVEQNICADVIKLCTNAVGSYSCNCMNGFQKDQTGSCIDVNECDNPSLNNCSHDCSNTIGSYSCSCRPGYKILNSLCQDINECTLGLAACEQMCENKPGTYNCYCHFGYRLNDDRRTCTKVSDPCKTLSNLTCSGYCVVNNNTTECRCQHGFVLGEDNQRCFDVDECERSTTNMCDPVSRCINTEGSYVCECPVGTRLENDGRTCSECDEYHFGRNCLQECNCIKGVCNSTLGCVCDDGWTGPNCDVDEDECVLESFTCTMPHMHCVNLPGTASCECIAGYHTDKMSGGCIDLNECLDVLTHDCAQICTNMNGSYECSCRTGFNQNGQKCTDIDECQGLRGCEQKCENTLGSYRCSCNEGYKLDLFDRHSCMPETECNTDQYSSCPKNSTCVVVSGDVMCTCPKGYSERTHVCADVDECVDNKHNCMQMCSNINGGYDCLCRIGFYLLSDGVSCDECRPWRYGANCDSSCSCLKDNSKSCNITSGECECKPGWTGESCAQNIDECSLDIFQLCPNDSQCVDNLGSFVCTCNTGFSKNRYGRCEECQHGRFGDGCGHTCGCYMHHTERCDYVTGHCTCDKGWKGVTCEEDNNECNDTNAFPRNSDCVNTMGSFECNCHTGFKKRRALGEECIKCYDFTYGGNCNEVCTCTEEHSTGCDNINGSCFCMQGWQGEACSEDVDECRDTSICDSKANSHCVNLIGSYECSCNAGYGVHNGDCKDVNECLTENLSACDKRARCENTAGNYTCECPAGTDLHDDGRSCIVCNNNTFGNGCNDQCNCTQENSETADQSCDTVTGSCLCNPHWTGRFCEMDVNECVTSGICKEANTGCRNIPGGFICDCLRGFTINNETGKCEYVLPSTALPAEDEVRVNLTLNLVVDLVPGTDLDVKAVFDQVAEKVEKSIRKHMSKYISVPFTILIDDLSLGSINVRYTLIFKKNSDVAKDIFKAVMDMRSGTEIEYDGRNVTALSQESISSDNACEFYETTLGGCGSGYECVYYAGEPTCIELSATDNYSLVVGVTVGLFVFLVAVFVTITAIVVYNRNRKKSSKNLRRESDDKPMPPYWPPWKNTNDTKSRYWNWRSLAMKNQFATPYHLPRAHTDQGSNEAGTQ